jgi:hypothetical protein
LWKKIYRFVKDSDVQLGPIFDRFPKHQGGSVFFIKNPYFFRVFYDLGGRKVAYIWGRAARREAGPPSRDGEPVLSVMDAAGARMAYGA